jgi:hypothetical protein
VVPETAYDFTHDLVDLVLNPATIGGDGTITTGTPVTFLHEVMDSNLSLYGFYTLGGTILIAWYISEGGTDVVHLGIIDPGTLALTQELPLPGGWPLD